MLTLLLKLIESTWYYKALLSVNLSSMSWLSSHLDPDSEKLWTKLWADMHRINANHKNLPL